MGVEVGVGLRREMVDGFGDEDEVGLVDVDLAKAVRAFVEDEVLVKTSWPVALAQIL